MSGFSIGQIEALARASGISFRDACRRSQRASTAAKRKKARVAEAARVAAERATRAQKMWWLKDGLE